MGGTYFTVEYVHPKREWGQPIKWVRDTYGRTSDEARAIAYACSKAKETCCRHRVLSVDGTVVFDTDLDAVKASPTAVGDMKAGLTNGKPQLSHIPHGALVYAARAAEWGNSPGKYVRGNYLRRQPDTTADAIRLLGYLDALLRHTTKITLALNRALGTTDATPADLKAAAACTDDVDGNGNPESGLPHLCGMLMSGLMAVQQAVDCGLIPADPGRPWEGRDKK